MHAASRAQVGRRSDTFGAHNCGTRQAASQSSQRGARFGSRVPRGYSRPACLLYHPPMADLCYAALPCCCRQSHRPLRESCLKPARAQGFAWPYLSGLSPKRKESLSRDLCPCTGAHVPWAVMRSGPARRSCSTAANLNCKWYKQSILFVGC